jgi:hypothetical protein
MFMLGPFVKPLEEQANVGRKMNSPMWMWDVAGVKVTMEPPQGIRANMLRTYGDISAAFLEDVDSEGSSSPERGRQWRSLVFACSFFHALIQVN